MSRWAQEDLKARDAFRKEKEKEKEKEPFGPTAKKMSKQEREIMEEINRMRLKRQLDKKHADRIRTARR